MTPQAKVGIVFIFAIVLAGFGGMWIAGGSLFHGGHNLLVHFRDVEGLSDGSSVTFTGVIVGRVTQVRLANETELQEFPELPVVAEITIDRDTPVLDTDDFIIGQSGPLGEAYLMIRRRTLEERTRDARLSGIPLRPSVPLKDKTHVVGDKQVSLMDMGSGANELVDQVKHTVANLNDILLASDARTRLPQILANVDDATANAVEFSKVLARLSVANESKMQLTAEKIATTVDEVNLAASRVRRLVDVAAPAVEEMTTSAKATMESTGGNLRRTAALLEDGTRRASKDLTELTSKANALLDASSGNIERSAENIAQVTDKIVKLVDDSSSDMSATTRRMNELVQKTAGDVESSSAILAQMTRNLQTDIQSITGDVKTTTSRMAKITETSGADLETITKRIRQLLNETTLPDDLIATGSHIRKTTENIEKITDNLADPEAQASIKRIVANLADASENISKLSGETSEFLQDGREFMTQISSQMGDETLWQDIRGTMSELNKSMQDLRTITAQGRELLADGTVTADIKASIGNVRAITQKGISLANKADTALSSINTIAGFISPERVDFETQLLGITDQGLRADLWTDYYSDSSGFWRLGARDLGDDTGLIFQRGLGLGSNTNLRAGFYDSRLALGLDHRFGRHLGIGLDAWDPEDPRLEVRGRLGLSNRFDLLFGATNVFTGTDPFIGLGIGLGGDDAATPTVKPVTEP